MSATPATPPLEPYVLADHPVLDMLNTRANVEAVPVSYTHLTLPTNREV